MLAKEAAKVIVVEAVTAVMAYEQWKTFKTIDKWETTAKENLKTKINNKMAEKRRIKERKREANEMLKKYWADRKQKERIDIFNKDVDNDYKDMSFVNLNPIQ